MNTKCKLGEGATPGPWKSREAAIGFEVVNDLGEIICSVSHSLVDEDIDEAHAHLIVKAPLLVEARDVLEQIANGTVMDQSKPYTYAEIVIAYQRLARVLLAKLDTEEKL